MHSLTIWPVSELGALQDPLSRAAIARLLLATDHALDQVQTHDLDRASPSDDSALMHAYIGIEDLTSSLLMDWYGDESVNDGLSALQRLVRHTQRNSLFSPRRPRKL